MEIDDPKLVFVPFEKATTPPPGLLNHIKDHYWCVHPDKGVIYFKPNKSYPHPGSAQANSNERIAQGLRDKLYPWAQVRFIPSVFYSTRPEDWI